MTVTRKLIKCTNQSEYECGKDALVSIFNAIILWSNVIVLLKEVYYHIEKNIRFQVEISDEEKIP